MISAVVESKRLKATKAPKDARKPKPGKLSKDHPKEVCLGEKGFLIQPAFDGEINAVSFCQKCCDPDCSNDPADTEGFEIFAQCGEDVVNGTDTGDFDYLDIDCWDTLTQTFPFGHEVDGENAAFEFTNSEAFIGKGSFRGIINRKVKKDVDPRIGWDDKVTLRYHSGEFDGFNREMKNLEVSKLEYIEYSFKATSCGVRATESCPQQFYLNVYTRTSAASTNNFDCQFRFVPAIGGDPSNPEWTTVRFDMTSKSTTQAFFGYKVCRFDDGSEIDSLDDVPEWVLGTEGNDPGVIFTLNMGIGFRSAGLEGFFDRVVVKLTVEESARVYDLEPGFSGFF